MSLAVLAHIARGGANGPRFLFPLLLLTLLGVLIGWLIRRRRAGIGGGGGGAQGDRRSAMQTLQDRFARGDIDRSEFEHRKAVLVGADVIPPMEEAPAAAGTPPETAASSDPDDPEGEA